MEDKLVDAVSEFQTNLSDPMLALWEKVLAFIPNLVAALLMLLIGYVLARVLSVILGKALSLVGFNKLGESTGLNKLLQTTTLKEKQPSYLIQAIVFWLVMLTFIVSSADALGLPQVSATMDKFVFFIPGVLAAALVLLVGLFIAQFVKTSIVSIATGLEAGHANVVANVVYGFLVVVIAALATAQLGIDVELLNDLIAIIVLAFAAGFALALGLGGKSIAESMLKNLFDKNSK